MKKSIYNLVVRDEEYTIILNTLSGNFVKILDPQKVAIKILDEKEICENDDVEILNILKRHHLLIEDNVDEEEVWTNGISQYIENKKNLNLVILPTELCNFRCPYCYENHMGETMDISLANKVIDFAKRLAADKECINVAWFGGEPLISYDIIKYISRELIEFSKKNRIKYVASMTTNGYLLTNDMVVKLRKLNVLQYQITVDGFAENHNRSRVLINGDGTWETIINNLRSISKYNNSALLQFIIRTNINHSNINKVNEFMSFFQREFGEDKRFKLLIRPVADWGNIDDSIRDSLLSSKEYYGAVLDTLNYKIKNVAVDMAITPFGLLCHAWKKNTYVICADGHLGKCTVLLNDKINYMGNVCNGVSITSNWDYFSKRIPIKCNKCKKYPICCKVNCHLEGSDECDIIVKNIENILPIIATEQYGCIKYD